MLKAGVKLGLKVRANLKRGTSMIAANPLRLTTSKYDRDTFAQGEQQGAALIIVLVVTSLVAIAAVTVSEQTQLRIYLTQNQRDSLQAKRYLQAAESHAILLLQAAIKEPTVHLQQSWANGRSDFEIDNGQLSIDITDQRSCLNLNMMADQIEQRAGQGLLSKDVAQLKYLMAELNISAAIQNLFIYRLKDWVDPDSERSDPYGEEDAFYLNAEPAYLAADAALAGLDELALLQVDMKQLSVMFPFVCVLPVGSGNRINLNTVLQPELLVALSNGLFDRSQAQSIINSRPEQGYQSLAEFINVQEESLRPAIAAMPLTLSSSFFRADLKVSYGRSLKQRSVFIRFEGDNAQVYKRVNKDG